MVISLVLALASLCWQTLLAVAGFKFEIARAAVPERSDRNFTLCELILCNASCKGLFVVWFHFQQVTLAVDTLVAIDDEIIGKPANMKEAVQIMRRLSGCSHDVCTAVFICQFFKVRTFFEMSKVRFCELTDNAIRVYLAKINPFDKAGAYAAQRAGSEIIEAIDGSFINVVGLSMQWTIVELRHFGIELTLA